MTSKKISEFIEQTSFQDGDELTIVRGGTNFKIDSDKLAAFLGVTGTISQVANSDAPILEQTSSTTNNIRGLEDGKGTQVSVTARNNVKVDHNFINGVTGGVDLSKDVTADQLTFRPIKAGNNISVSIDMDSILVSSRSRSAGIALPSTF